MGLESKYAKPRPRRKIDTRTLPSQFKVPKIHLFFDGSCWPNPGGSIGYGFHIIDKEDNDLHADSGYYPNDKINTSSNVAEYMALIAGMEWLINNNFSNEPIRVFGDSMMVINQMTGNWGINEGFYTEYAKKARKIRLEHFRRSGWIWIPRDLNGRADELSKCRV